MGNMTKANQGEEQAKKMGTRILIDAPWGITGHPQLNEKGQETGGGGT